MSDTKTDRPKAIDTVPGRPYQVGYGYEVPTKRRLTAKDTAKENLKPNAMQRFLAG